MFTHLISWFFFTFFTSGSVPQNATSQISHQISVADSNTVVLELFTSQGCSSCPPADKLAARLKEEYKGKLAVLEFHVDYWDRLGWKDPFSSAAYTQRQRNYSDKFRSESIYTPQAVINGRFEAVGSDERKLKVIINSVLTEKVNTKLDATVTSVDGAKVVVSWKSVAAANALVSFALVQKQHSSVIGAGENSGRKLVQTNIVRDFVSATSSSHTQQIKLEIPKGLAKSEMQIVGFIQSGSEISSTIIIESL